MDVNMQNVTLVFAAFVHPLVFSDQRPTALLHR